MLGLLRPLWDGRSKLNKLDATVSKVLLPLELFQASMDAGITPNQMINAWREAPDTIKWLIENPDKRVDAYIDVITSISAVSLNTAEELSVVAPPAAYYIFGKDIHVTGQRIRQGVEWVAEPISDKLGSLLFQWGWY